MPVEDIVYVLLMSSWSHLHSLEQLLLPIIYSTSSHQSPDLIQPHLIKLDRDPNIDRLHSLLKPFPEPLNVCCTRRPQDCIDPPRVH